MNVVSLKDYEGLNGFGPGLMATESDIENLNKALAAGTALLPTVGGDTLRVESLEGTMRVTTFTLGNIKLFKKAPRLPAYSTVEEFNLLEGYGQEGMGLFTLEGELPQLTDSQYRRKAAFVKFMGIQGEVTLPMSLVRTAHGNAVAIEVQNKAIKLMSQLEENLFKGNSATIPQSFDGLLTQILSDPAAAVGNVIDCRTVSAAGSAAGQIMEDYLELGATIIIENFGVPDQMFLTPRALSDVTRQFYPRERIALPYPAEGRVGLSVKSFESSAGPIEFNSDVFLRPGRTGGASSPPTTATSASAPNPPAAVVPGAAAPDALSRFVAGDNGNYIYGVTAVNRFGESAPTWSGLTAIAAAQSTVVAITDGGGGTTGFKVYRTTVGGAAATARLMTEVSLAASSYTDRNIFLPGASMAVLFQNNLHFWSWRQLAPMMRVPLATISQSIRWMQLLYGCPIVYAPRKSCIFLNVRDQTGL